MTYSIQCLKKASEAAERHDDKMVKFWNDQYTFSKYSKNIRDRIKEQQILCIKYRLEVRNPLTTAAYEGNPLKMQSKRIIYVRGEK